jgi:hypothetical protein
MALGYLLLFENLLEPISGYPRVGATTQTRRWTLTDCDRVTPQWAAFHGASANPASPPPTATIFFIASRWLHYFGHRQKNVHRN